MPFRLSQDAQEDIVKISAAGIDQFGERQARIYHDALFDMFDLLAANPQMARERVEFSTPVRIHRFQSHIIIYQIEGDDILIIRVRHGREDWLNSLE
tara:strand:+ start:9590 stop:9880 length:291 start_codon:yes stop_codon:yes gene_type:complete